MHQRLATVLVILLVLSGVGLVAPTAGAVTAPTAPTITVSRSVVDSGDTVVVRGTVRGTSRRTRVRLQVRSTSGWKTVASARATRRHTYAFRTRPADGDQRYRVQVPPRPGAPARTSRPVSVRTQWRPSVALVDATHRTAVGGAVTTRVRGTAPRLGGAVLQREVASGGAWRSTGTVLVAAAGEWTDTFPSAHGDLVRYVAPAAGARLAATSPAVDVDGSWTPVVVVTVTSGDAPRMAVSGSVPGVAAGTQVQRQSAAGDVWTTESVVQVTPAGEFTDVVESIAARAYRYVVPSAGPRGAAVSRTLLGPPVDTSPPPGPDPEPDPEPEPEPDPEPDPSRVEVGRTTSVRLAAGVSDLSLPVALSVGQTVTYSGPTWTVESLTSPSGAALPGFGPGSGPVTVTATESGDHVLRLTRTQADQEATADVTLSEPLRMETTLDGAPVDLATTLPDQLVDLVFAAPAGALVSEHAVGPAPFEPPPGAVALLGPSGQELPRLGQLVREGGAWKLPDIAGDYVLRIAPAWRGTVDRAQQSVLLGVQATATVDGAPAHVELDRPGRVALVSTTTPAGLDVRLSNTGPVHLLTEVFGPNGDVVPVHSNTPDLDATDPGTYTQLVSHDGLLAADFYASTPLELAVGTGSTGYDLGPAPHRVVHASIRISDERLFAVEVLDELGLCARNTDEVAGGDLVVWGADVPDQPTVLRTVGDGELVLALHPCERTGTIRVQDVEIVTAEITSVPAPDVTISRATLSAPTPGRLMMVAFDADFGFDDTVTLTRTGTTFPAGTTVMTAAGSPESSGATNHGLWAPDQAAYDYRFARGPQLVYLYAGPGATGTLDLEIRVDG